MSYWLKVLKNSGSLGTIIILSVLITIMGLLSPIFIIHIHSPHLNIHAKIPYEEQTLVDEVYTSRKNCNNSDTSSSGRSSGIKCPQFNPFPRILSARFFQTVIMSKLPPVCHPGRFGMLPPHSTRTGQVNLRPRSTPSCSRSTATLR